MRRIRIVGLCLVAVFAIGAVTATGASAFGEPPEVGRCLPKAGGDWKNSGCSVPSTATEKKFEWYPAFKANKHGETKLAEKLKFTSSAKEGALIQLETVKEEKIICKGTNGNGKEGQTSEGEVTGPKTNVATKIIFRGCEFTEVGVCKNTATSGEITVNDLDGTIGFQTETGEQKKWKVANLFKPKTGSIFTEFTCGGAPVVVKSNSESLGGVLNPITANAMKLTATVKFTASKGKQKPEKFAADPLGTKRTLLSNKLGGAFAQAGQTLTTIQKNGEKLEVNTLE
jgi:hypothetical protein